MRKLLLLIGLISLGISTYGQFWNSTGALGSGGSYLIAAAVAGGDIYTIDNVQQFAYSSDGGQTWIRPTISAPSGTFAALYGTSGALYASTKVSTFVFDLWFSTDQGQNWTIDTVGLPAAIGGGGKAGVTVEDMGGGYLMAYNSTASYVKAPGTNSWTKVTIDNVVIDVEPMNGDWYAVGVQKIVKSSDHGNTWSPVAGAGLPSAFQGAKLTSNDDNRLFVSNPPADGGDDIYISTDGGATWTLTNSSGIYTHANAWLGSLYAVDDYVFAAITPANFNDPPPYISSSATTPNFTLGDSTGLPRGGTVTSIPFFFHLGTKLYTMFGNLYSCTPGFTGTNNANITEAEGFKVRLYPNPAKERLFVESDRPLSAEVYSMTGQRLQFTNVDVHTPISLTDLPKGAYMLKLSDGHHKHYERFLKQ